MSYKDILNNFYRDCRTIIDDCEEEKQRLLKLSEKTSCYLTDLRECSVRLSAYLELFVYLQMYSHVKDEGDE